MSSLIPNWSTLRGAGNSHFSRLTVLTPVFGYIILYIDFFRNIPLIFDARSSTSANFSEAAPIYLIYFGLCIFSVGIVIYQLLCSDVVKRYDDQISYVIAVAQNISKFECEYILQRIDASPSTSAKARSKAQIILNSFQVSPDISRENRVFVLTEHYNILNADNWLGRLIASFFMVLGAILILLPTIMTFGSIVGSLAR